jgi:hypothetical protein
MIYRNTTDDWGTATPVEVLTHGETVLVDRGLSGNTIYYYWVRGSDGTSDTAPSASLAVVTAPSEVRIVHIAPTGPTEARVQWSALSNVTAYTLFRAGTADPLGAVAIAGTGAEGTAAVDAGLAPGTTYYYWVLAYNVSGKSPFGAPVVVSTPATSGQPAADLAAVMAGPSPFHPDSGESFRFENLTRVASMRVWTISGHLVANVQMESDDGRYDWSVTNDAGESLATGVYVCEITNPAGDRAVLKFAVVQ